MITNLLAILTSAAEEGTLGEITARPRARRRVASQPRHDGQGRTHHRCKRPTGIRNHRSLTIRPRAPPTTQGSDPISTNLAVERGADEEAKDGMRRRGAEGKGAAAALTELSAFRMGFLPSALGAGLQVRAIGLSP
jgi:hypothetical protein